MIILSQREIAILEFVHFTKYGYGTHIREAFFASVSREAMSKTMRKLEGNKLLDSFMVPANLSSLMNKEKVYFLSEKGAEYIAEEQGKSLAEIGYKKVGNKPVKMNQIYHRKQQNNALIRIKNDLEGTDTIAKFLLKDYERVKLENGGFRESTTIWTKDEQHQISPDITVVLRNQAVGKEALFFIEVDCKTETVYGRTASTQNKSLYYKYDMYLKMYLDGNWKNLVDTTAQAFKVLTITEDFNHIETIRDKAEISHQNQDHNFLKYPEMFLFSTHEWIKEYGLFQGKSWLGFEKEFTEGGEQVFITAL